MKSFITYVAVSLLILVGLTLFITRPRFDKQLFTTRLAQIQANDILGTQVFSLGEEVPNDDYLQIAQGGLTKYAESKDLLIQMSQMTDIPAREAELVADVQQYTELRTEMIELLVLSVQTGEISLVDDISNLGKRIEALEIYQDGLQLEQDRQPGQG